jgi:hypothetical protein
MEPLKNRWVVIIHNGATLAAGLTLKGAAPIVVTRCWDVEFALCSSAALVA